MEKTQNKNTAVATNTVNENWLEKRERARQKLFELKIIAEL